MTLDEFLDYLAAHRTTSRLATRLAACVGLDRVALVPIPLRADAPRADRRSVAS